MSDINLGTIDLVIPSGAALSNEVPLMGKVIIGLQMPAAWDAANLTFLSGAVAGALGNVYDESAELTVQTAAGRFHALSADKWGGFRRIQLRSGTSATPVNQTAARTITVIVRERGAR